MVGTLYFLAFRHNFANHAVPFLFLSMSCFLLDCSLHLLLPAWVTLGGEAAGESAAGAILQIHPHTQG